MILMLTDLAEVRNVKKAREMLKSRSIHLIFKFRFEKTYENTSVKKERNTSIYVVDCIFLLITIVHCSLKILNI